MKDPPVELRIKGDTDLSGEFRGKGEFTLHVSDAARARFLLDYRRPDSLTVTLESTVGIQLAADDSLTLSGGLSRDVFNGQVKGHVSARLRITKDLSAELEQSFGPSGPKTSFELKVRL